MRRWLSAAAIVVALAGCDVQADASVPEPPLEPAAKAGGACELLDFELLQHMLGARYAVAASAGQDTTMTCVARTADDPYPEVTLAVAPSIADVAVFKAKVQPKGSIVVEGLGKVAYRAELPAADGTGPALEVGWLAANARLLWLRVTVPSGASAGELGLRLVVLAQEIDKVKPAAK
ncbi:hypothetical protein F4553_005785 [Allocatelliglobosispora scoriae]|uniref:DUF3558 domain-containing protein n=2 Tax=Allocatelliglobosispora scoriae TaxID=643052 RepID=A0A841C0D6_9ACTN|nr:hypothetical protein [Allocatelliglobosispora scoriae]